MKNKTLLAFMLFLSASLTDLIAILNYITNKSKANLWLFFGALFFITSDSILAIVYP